MIYAIGRDAEPRILDWNDPYGMHQSIAAALHLDPVDLLTFHHVQARPQDLFRADTEPVIAHRVHDLTAGSRLQFILLDVEFHSSDAGSMPEAVRRVQLLMDTISRERPLRQLGLQDYCARVSNRCLLWINNEIIPLSAAQLYLHDGDYLRIALPPGARRMDHVATRCLAKMLSIKALE